MCTVTYLPKKNGFFFTSNRDEQSTRKTLVPAYYKDAEVSLFFPKDEVAGGTWIGLSDKRRLVCLLNGGFVYHNPKIKFPKSRGVVVTSILKSDDVKQTLDTIDLNGVAPFTLIVVDWKETTNMYELVWCREQKHVTKLATSETYIWSSSTLYTSEMKTERKKWFQQSFDAKESVKISDILEFHQNKEFGTVETAPKMKRKEVETISTTLVTKENEKVAMEYHDYVADKKHLYQNIFEQTKVSV